MTTFLRNFRRSTRHGDRQGDVSEPQPVAARARAAPGPVFEIAPNDPLVAYFLSVPGAAEIDRLRLESTALDAMRAAGVKMVVPLVSQGELIGVISMGPHLSQQGRPRAAKQPVCPSRAGSARSPAGAPAAA